MGLTKQPGTLASPTEFAKHRTGTHNLAVLGSQSKPWERTAALLAGNSREPHARNIGLEIERIGMWPDGTSLHYRAPGPDRPGAEQIITALSKEFGWSVVTYSEKFPLGLNGPVGKVSLEPGSQLEFAANPVVSVGEAESVIGSFEAQVEKVTSPWGLCWLGIGVNPVATVEDMDVIPLTRYRIMTDFLSARGKLATTMMRLTSSVQLNFDYSSEKEAISMLRTGLAVAPLSYALFGNSPISAGTPNGWLSQRSEVWRNTDPQRSGLMDEAFSEDFSFAKYAELAWKRPLMFVQNEKGENVESHGRNLIEIGLGHLEAVSINTENELNTLRQIFTEARLKPGYIEIRSIDGLRPSDRYAATAFWTGLIYSEEARLLALDRLGTLSSKLRNEFWIAAGREGLKASVGGIELRKLGLELLEASRRSLRRRGMDEEKYLKPIEKTLAEGKNPANRILDLYQGPWKGNLAELIRYSALP